MLLHYYILVTTSFRRGRDGAVTLDYLIDESASISFDRKTVKRLEDIENLNDNDKNHLFAMMDAFLRDAKARKAYS